MTDDEWRKFFLICARVPGRGDAVAFRSASWCGWTTFRKLQETVHYWSAGLPAEEELAPSYVRDGGTWGQPFLYQEIAHVVIPRQFSWEIGAGSEFRAGDKGQDIDRLSEELTAAGIAHRKTDLLLEIKLY